MYRYTMNRLIFEHKADISRYVNIDRTNFYMTCPRCLSSFDYPEAWRDGDNMVIDGLFSSHMDNYRCIFCESELSVK